MVGADAVEGAEGRTEVPTKGEARKSTGVEGAGHASRGLPRNLGSLLISTEKSGRRADRIIKEPRPGRGAHEPPEEAAKETADTNNTRVNGGTSQTKETKCGRTDSR